MNGRLCGSLELSFAIVFFSSFRFISGERERQTARMLTNSFFSYSIIMKKKKKEDLIH